MINSALRIDYDISSFPTKGYYHLDTGGRSHNVPKNVPKMWYKTGTITFCHIVLSTELHFLKIY